jgi:hypothetical protein
VYCLPVSLANEVAKDVEVIRDRVAFPAPRTEERVRADRRRVV